MDCDQNVLRRVLASSSDGYRNLSFRLRLAGRLYEREDHPYDGAGTLPNFPRSLSTPRFGGAPDDVDTQSGRLTATCSALEQGVIEDAGPIIADD